jgi:outer membrane protein OmpA-like peptidoglycan-associated protein
MVTIFNHGEGIMNNPMKKGCVLLLIMLLSVSGCKQKKKAADKSISATDKGATVSMPVAPGSKELVFDDDLAEFALVDDTAQNVKNSVTTVATADPKEAEEADEFSWIDDEDQRQGLKTVYFDFDKYAIKKDQEVAVEQDIKALKKTLADAEKDSKKVTAVVEGHACHSAGSASYNLALSEKRAHVLKDRLVEGGIPSSQIKVVGRGQECPALGKDGKPVTGSREQQWPNRRDEINIINA